jgi:hypothetical protein
MDMACEGGNLKVALWLLLQGAANDDDGHVDRAIISSDTCLRTIDLLFAPLL